MADHLILSLQPPPFRIFPSSLHRRWGFSRRFPGGVSFSNPEFRLSTQLQLANSTSPSESCLSSSSSPEKFDLVSSTQLKDGSHVFRFGDASEIERNLETEEKARCLEVEKQHAKIAEEASEVSRKQLVDLDPVSELEGPKAKSDASEKTVNSNIETVSEKEETVAPASLIKIKDRKRVRSPTKRKKETSTSVNVTRSEAKVEAEIARMTNLSSMVSVAEAIPTSSTEEKVVLSKKSEPTNENVEPLSSQVMEKVSVNEIRDCEPNGYQQLTENPVEVQASPIPSTSQQDSQLNDLKEVARVSAIELDENLDVTENTMKTFAAEENLVVEPTATAAVPSNELISTSAAAVVEIAETPVIDTSEVANDGETVASTVEDEITVSDTKTDNSSMSTTVSDTKVEDHQLPAPETPGLQSIEVASDRGELVSKKALYLESGFASLQIPFKALAGREDAYFISHDNWLGVADGVSQWSFEGINEGMYAQELMSNCQKIISDETAERTDPVQVLHRSVSETNSQGSSTALIAHLDNNELHIANIGDSGFMVIRNGTELQKSSPMFHHFGFPLQVTQGDDVLKLAEVYHVNMEEGDVVITATDGLFDNLYEKEIVSIVCRSLDQSLEPQKIAELVATKAQEVGRSETERTPFADAAKEEGYDGYKGGKVDAVTVIVSLVKTLSI